MDTTTRSITIANDDSLCELISAANRRLIILSPAVSLAVAEAISGRWRMLGPDAVNVILDINPSVYRIG